MSPARITDTAVDPIFLDRWSPRAFDGSIMPPEDLRTILDAARWAPSAYNYQPWRFIYAQRDDTANWDTFLSLLIPFNRLWAKQASVLVFIASETIMSSPDMPSPTHSFDAGAAWMAIAMQSHLSGYHAHAMAGFDPEGSQIALHVPPSFKIDAAVAIGSIGDSRDLPEQLREREIPSDRKSLKEIAYRGTFKF